jgi:hypothetical protein
MDKISVGATIGRTNPTSVNRQTKFQRAKSPAREGLHNIPAVAEYTVFPKKYNKKFQVYAYMTKLL